MKKPILICALLLAGCNGGSYHGPSDEGQVADRFLAYVESVVAVTSDDGDAPAIDAMVATAPDDEEPKPL